nr:hypothetical protein [Aliarcobacter skirrowii]
MNKKWFIKYSLILFIGLVFIGSFNYFIDPFWTFSHNHKYNSVQKGMNERQQKANYIYFTDKKFDTLLLGSSRTTYMNRHSFEPFNVFNFSASGMRPREYLTYIDFTIKDSNQPIDTIIIGMDFFGYFNTGTYSIKDSLNIINSTKSTAYRWKILLSFDTLNNSFKNVRDYFKKRGSSDRYDRDLVKSMQIRDNKILVEKQIRKDILIYSKNEYVGELNHNYVNLLKNIKNKYSDKKFIIYTTPVSEPLFREMISLGNYNNYISWLKELVDIFGEVHHFMYINHVSKNYLKYFGDSNHAYPHTNDILAKTIMSNYKNKLDDFGILLNKDNIDEKLGELNAIQ